MRSRHPHPTPTQHCTTTPPSPALPLWTEPDHERAQRNLDYFTRELAESEAKYNVVATERVRNIGAETLHYEKLCREADPLVSGCGWWVWPLPSGCACEQVQSLLSSP